MGLGLYLVGATVENHRGSVRLGRSKELGGAKVTLRFPMLHQPGSNRQPLAPTRF
jgi:signal transduction histidine kinase